MTCLINNNPSTYNYVLDKVLLESMKIGIFDSGVGGQSFIEPIKIRFPDSIIIYKEDKKNIPYGNKTPEELLELTLPIFRSFEEDKCDVVVVACNTVTTTIINQLRENLSVPLVGVEPMIKPAEKISKTKKIAVCATPATLNSNRYKWLKENYAKDIVVEEPDCSNWAYMIENNRQNELLLQEMVSDLHSKNVDVIVLGCTHYHWIEEELKQFAGDGIAVIQPKEPVINQIERIIANSQN
jgi:glutamate racemase